MKSFNNFLFTLITLFIINISYGKYNITLSNDDKNAINKPLTVSEKNKEEINDNNKENYYLIYVKNTHGEYKIYNNDKKQKRDESEIFIESVLDKINTLIVDNKDTYIYPEKLDRMDKGSPLGKRSDEEENDIETGFVYPISSIKETVVLYSYLSKKILKEIKSMPYVNHCEVDQASFTVDHRNYNEEDILAETGWKKLGVREKADFHLSLISQGIFRKQLVNKYDNNYYYPASAGKGIDIVVLDSGFNFNDSEFLNDKERIIQCSAIIQDGKASINNEKFCGNSEIIHGEEVADIAAGYKHGSANLANVYGVAVVANERGSITNSDILGGISYIYENMIRPHKTVINISISGYRTVGSDYYNQYKEIVDGITKKGGIIVSSAGNTGIDLGNMYTFVVPCQYDNVICVGGIENQENNKEASYVISEKTNYGPGVDIYAPINVKAKIYTGDESYYTSGTSFSSPLVAGIIATMMSDNPNIKYTKDRIFEELKENGKSEIIDGQYILANNGKHIVYSEDNKYYGCGIYAGNRPCTDDTSSIIMEPESISMTTTVYTTYDLESTTIITTEYEYEYELTTEIITEPTTTTTTFTTTTSISLPPPTITSANSITSSPSPAITIAATTTTKKSTTTTTIITSTTTPTPTPTKKSTTVTTIVTSTTTTTPIPTKKSTTTARNSTKNHTKQSTTTTPTKASTTTSKKPKTKTKVKTTTTTKTKPSTTTSKKPKTKTKVKTTTTTKTTTSTNTSKKPKTKTTVRTTISQPKKSSTTITGTKKTKVTTKKRTQGKKGTTKKVTTTTTKKTSIKKKTTTKKSKISTKRKNSFH